MRKLIKIFFIIVILIFELFMFQISLEIGAVSLVLIFATFCIGFVINKITTVVEQPNLELTSEPFKDTSKHADNKTKSDKVKTSDSESLIPGVDSSIFEQFRKKFNLKQTKSVDEDDIASAVNFLSSDESKYITAQTINVSGGIVF